MPANFGPMSSSSKRLGPLAWRGDPLAHMGLERLPHTFQYNFTHSSYQLRIPHRDDIKKWWTSFSTIRMNPHKRLHRKIHREGPHRRILLLLKNATWEKMRSYRWQHEERARWLAGGFIHNLYLHSRAKAQAGIQQICVPFHFWPSNSNMLFNH
jgi:hypothetical protein